jgi:hypothetical protein
MSGNFFSSSITTLIRSCRCRGDITGVVAGEDGDVTGVITGEGGSFSGVVADEVRGFSIAAKMQSALSARVQPSKDGDAIEVFADEDGVTRVIADEDGGFTGVVVGEAGRCSVAARVQSAVTARCSRRAMSMYCGWVETNGYI